MTAPTQIPDEELEALEAQFAAYVDGDLPADEAAALEERLSSDPACRAAFDEFQQTLAALTNLHKMAAPPAFQEDVTETIHRRSAGLFFGRRAFGDRVPFELLALFALAVILAVALWIRGTVSTPGSSQPATDAPAPEVREAIPRP